MPDLHARGVAAQIRANHIPHTVRIPRQLRRRRVCSLCGQPIPCNRLVLAADIEAGRRDTAGQPLWAERVRPWPQVWRASRPWLALCVIIAAVFGWPIPQLLS
jgi:hypothetical protein